MNDLLTRIVRESRGREMTLRPDAALAGEMAEAAPSEDPVAEKQSDRTAGLAMALLVKAEQLLVQAGLNEMLVQDLQATRRMIKRWKPESNRVSIRISKVLDQKLSGLTDQQD